MRLYQRPSALALSLVQSLILQPTSVFTTPLTFQELSKTPTAITTPEATTYQPTYPLTGATKWKTAGLATLSYLPTFATTTIEPTYVKRFCLVN